MPSRNVNFRDCYLVKRVDLTSWLFAQFWIFVGLDFDKVSSTKIMHAGDRAIVLAISKDDVQANEIGEVKLILVFGFWQANMVDKQRGAFEGLRSVAIINALEAGHHTLFGDTHFADFELAFILLIAERSVGFDIQRISGVALDHHLAMYAMDAGDDPKTEPF